MRVRIAGIVRWQAVGVCALSAIALGCSRADRVAKANDELRAQNVELESKVNQLNLRVKELEGELKTTSAASEGLPEDIRANIPHVAALSIGRLSHFRDGDRDGRPETLVLYVQPADGRGRVVQLVGPVSVNAALLPAEADATTIGRATFAPSEVRDAYRSSMTGTHYTFEVPVALAELPSDGNATVRVEYTDGVTGSTFETQREIRLQ